MAVAKSKKSVTYQNVDLVPVDSGGAGHYYHKRVTTKGEKANMKLELRKYNKFLKAHVICKAKKMSKGAKK